MKKKIVSISEFSKITGIPKVEVYRMIAEEANKPFVSIVDGMKMVDIAILDKPKIEDIKEDAETPLQSAQEPEQKPAETETAIEIDRMRERITALEAEINRKDEEINRLSLLLADMAQKTAEISEKALNTVAQQQYLTAIATKKLPWYKRLLPIGRGGADAEL